MDTETENLENQYTKKIRRYFDRNSNKWFFSIVDIIGLATNSSDPRNYWKVFKNRLKKTHNQLVTSCKPFKMESNDGKFYLTDTADTETVLEILTLVATPAIPYFKSYLSSLDNPKSSNVVSLHHINLKSKNHLESNGRDNASSYPHEEDSDADFSISIDLYRDKNLLFLKAFIGDVSLSDLDITATYNSLTISGHREFRNKINIDNYNKQEISWGKFYRRIILPLEININKIEATDDRGLLTITMETVDKSYTRRVKIL